MAMALNSVLFSALLVLSLRTAFAWRSQTDEYLDTSFLDLEESESDMIEHHAEDLAEENSGTPLFEAQEDRFREVAAALAADDTSVYSRILTAFREDGSKSVVVGAGGAGKTETIERVLEDGGLKKASFDLRGWYFDSGYMGAYVAANHPDKAATISDKDAYKLDYNAAGSSLVKKDQLDKLKKNEEAITNDIKSKDANVIFFDEVDLSPNGVMNDEELEAIKLLLQWGNAIAPTKSKVVVLHPLASTQPEVIELLRELGYATPGTSGWIEFSEAYPETVESTIVDTLLLDCTGSAAERSEYKNRVMQYVGGLPGAYVPFFIDKNSVLGSLSGKTFPACLEIIKDTATAKVGGKLVMINLGFSTSPATRAIIKGLLQSPDAIPAAGNALNGAVSCMAVMKRGSTYYIPPVERAAIAGYCDSANAKKKAIVAPICD